MGFLCCIFFHHSPAVVSPFAAKHNSSTLGSAQLGAGSARSAPSSRLSRHLCSLLETENQSLCPLFLLPPARASCCVVGDTALVLRREQLDPRKRCWSHQPPHQELSHCGDLGRDCFTSSSFLRWFGMFLFLCHGLKAIRKTPACLCTFLEVSLSL